MESNEKNICVCCGTELIPYNSKGVRPKWYGKNILPLCIDCQNKRYAEFKENTKNKQLALYLTCATFDAPFYIEHSDEAKDWIDYLKIIREKGLNKNKKTNEIISFGGGDTKAEIVHEMRIKPKKAKIDMQEAKVRWGVKFSEDGVAIEYTEKEIEELDSLYNEQAAEYKGAITPRVEMSLREICVNRLEWKRCVGVGDSQGAKRFSDMIKDAMAREGMRVGDQKPIEATRIDSIIVNLEKMGAVRDGKIISKNELLKVLANHHPKYNTSLDVVDEMMFAIVNTMKRNNGEPAYDALPKEAQVNDLFGELLTEQTQHEIEAQSELGIIPPNREM